MLKIWTYRERAQIENQLQKIDFENETWILSDLRSKLEIQNRLFSKYGYSLDHFVMRASDLWKTILRKTNPEIEVISLDYADLMIKNYLRSLPQENDVFMGLTESVWIQHLHRWQSVAFSEALQIELSEYLDQNETLKQSVARDFYLAKILADFFKRDKKIVSSWIPSILQTQMSLHQVWDRPLWIDLRGELSLSEAELFQALSREIDVHILAPDSDFEEKYPEIFKPYEYLKSKAQHIEKLVSLSQPHKAIQNVYQFSGPLAEVKSAVSQVRSWLESGTLAEEIAIVAPDIEAYWPCLSSYLKEEGLPAQKPVVSRLLTFPNLRLWMAQIRSSLNPRDYSSLEKIYFADGVQLENQFEKFRSLLFEIYEETDLARVKNVFESVQKYSKWPDLVSRDEFVAKILQLWERISYAREFPTELVQALEKFLREAAISEQAQPEHWFLFFESIVRQTEVTVSEKNENGVIVTSLMSAWSSQLQKVIFLGIAEESLKSFSRVGLSPVDSGQLSRDIGVVIESVEKSYKEYELRWWLLSTSLEISLYEPSTDWQGQLLNHSSLLLNYEKKQIQNYPTRWDQVQSLNLEDSLKHRNPLSAVSCASKINQDLGALASLPVKDFLKSELSPSSIEAYQRCHFIFLASHGFNLLDLENIDIDIDRRQSGQFYHALVEALLEQKPDLLWTIDELSALVENLRAEHLEIQSEDPTWPPRKSKFIKWCEHFINFEKKWRAEFPQTRIYDLESAWRFEYKKDQDVFAFRGKVDRIDENEKNQWVILDYKSSTAGKSSPSSWIKNNELQLLFYIWAQRSGAFEGAASKEVVGAFYYDLKKLNRSKGLQVQIETNLLPALKRKNSGVSLEKLDEYIASLEEKVMQVLDQMKSGDYSPQPEDEKSCLQCRWKEICRAPHLNQM